MGGLHSTGCPGAWLVILHFGKIFFGKISLAQRTKVVLSFLANPKRHAFFGKINNNNRSSSSSNNSNNKTINTNFFKKFLRRLRLTWLHKTCDSWLLKGKILRVVSMRNFNKQEVSYNIKISTKLTQTQFVQGLCGVLAWAF